VAGPPHSTPSLPTTGGAVPLGLEVVGCRHKTLPGTTQHGVCDLATCHEPADPDDDLGDRGAGVPVLVVPDRASSKIRNQIWSERHRSPTTYAPPATYLY